MDLRFGHWPSDCAVTIAEEHFILKIFVVLKNFGSVLLVLFQSKRMCSVAKDRAVSLTSSKTITIVLDEYSQEIIQACHIL